MEAHIAMYNDIGIKNDLDWNRIRKLLRIGLFAGVMVLIGDMLLGWGVSDPALTGASSGPRSSGSSGSPWKGCVILPSIG